MGKYGMDVYGEKREEEPMKTVEATDSEAD